MKELAEFDPESCCGRAIRALPRLFGSFTLDQLDFALGGSGVDRSGGLRILEDRQFIRRDHGFNPANQMLYLATAKGLRWATLLEYLMTSPEALVKSPMHPAGRALIAALRHSGDHFSAADVEMPLRLPVGSLHAVLDMPLFIRVPTPSDPRFSLTSAGRSNAAILDNAWREMYEIIRTPSPIHPVTPSASTPAGPKSERANAQRSARQGGSHLAISTRGLARQFPARGRRKEAVQAVKGIDIDVRRGELLGFLGPNGAGKTTTMRMLATLLRPTAGEAVVAGCDLRKDPRGVRRRIGYVAQNSGSSDESTVEEELIIQGRIHGLSKDAARNRSDELTAQLGLVGLGKRLCKTLSGGQRRRLDIAMGLVHSPDLIFLDEPTTGLDPQSRARLWKHIRWMRSELGMTAFLTTHYLDEAEALCDRIVIMDEGEIIAEGTPDDLKATVSGDSLILRVPVECTETAAGIADQVEGSSELSASDGLIRMRVPRSGAVTPGLLRALEEAHIPAKSLQVNQPSLNDVFLKLTGHSLHENVFESQIGIPKTFSKMENSHA
ncbi:daunorubicin resistance ABC transporter ATP-binding subunit [Streptomyces sp. B3I7]|uniref:ATP-binding cassette domain-containing protein n=1 Tax=Streptomyces sp. B3I7 TaxID=3042269 RepID=UPI0027857899|nr:ATP-binding cassette domain-containing protein [Streptomyces sp. B3I7]MDQ0808369.1 daunorubicin resistance ABC transporter ATP-binding subunit [Streptomyces sp. B3I7]